jgi:hypothetical protein
MSTQKSLSWGIWKEIKRMSPEHTIGTEHQVVHDEKTDPDAYEKVCESHKQQELRFRLLVLVRLITNNRKMAS